MSNPEFRGPNPDKDVEFIECVPSCTIGLYLEILQDAAIEKRKKVRGSFNGVEIFVDFDAINSGRALEQRTKIYEQLGISPPAPIIRKKTPGELADARIHQELMNKIELVNKAMIELGGLDFSNTTLVKSWLSKFGNASLGSIDFSTEKQIVLQKFATHGYTPGRFPMDRVKDEIGISLGLLRPGPFRPAGS